MAINLSTFMNEGAQIPAGSALKASQTETIMPQFYTDYAQQILANQQAVSGQPYQTYQGPRVAEFSPAQQQGFAMTGQAAEAYKPALSGATAATTNLMGQTALSGAQPYFTAATQLNPSETAQADYGSARNLVTQAGAANPVAAASPYLSAASTMSGVQAAQPFIDQAGATSADVSQYMDPYVQNVVKQVADLGERNLRETLLPALTSKYINAGQLGFSPRGGAVAPSGMMTDTARALRDVQEAALREQGQLLSTGFQKAREAAQTDLARKAQLASTVGNLVTQQQQNLADIGSRYGTLTTAGQTGQLNAAQQLAELGTAGARLTADQQKFLADLGVNTANIRGADITRNLAAAEQLAGLGGLAQKYGLEGAGAVTGVGKAQQEQAQKNIDVAYENYLKQQGYNQEQIDKMLATFKGVAGGIPTITQDYGIVPTGQQAQYQPSTASTIAGTLAGLAGLLGIGK